MANALYGRCEANKPITITLGNMSMVVAPAQFWPTYWLAKNRSDYNYNLMHLVNRRLTGNDARNILIKFGLVSSTQIRKFDGRDFKKVLLLRIRLEKVKVYLIRNTKMQSVLLGDNYLSVNCKSAFSLEQYDKPGIKAQRDKLALELSQILVHRRGNKIRLDDIYWSHSWLSRKFIIAGSVIKVFADSVAALVKLGVAIVVGLYTVAKAYVRTLHNLATGDFKAVQNDLSRLIGGVVLGIEKLEANIKMGYDIISTIWNDEHSKKLLFAFMSEYVDGTSVVDSATFKISLTIDVILIIGTLGAGAVVVGARLAHRVGQFTVRALNFIVELYRALKLIKPRRVIDSKSPVKQLPAPKTKSPENVGSNKSSTSEKTEAQNNKQTGSGKYVGSADEAYDAIRRSTTDVNAIAKNTGIKPKNIQKVKDHIFNNEHLLDRYVDYGIPAQKKRFDSDKGMADAWKRLENGTYTDKDIKLLKHEMAESWYMKKHGPGYNNAHNAAERRYPAPDLEGK